MLHWRTKLTRRELLHYWNRYYITISVLENRRENLYPLFFSFAFIIFHRVIITEFKRNDLFLHRALLWTKMAQFIYLSDHTVLKRYPFVHIPFWEARIHVAYLANNPPPALGLGNTWIIPGYLYNVPDCTTCTNLHVFVRRASHRSETDPSSPAEIGWPELPAGMHHFKK